MREIGLQPSSTGQVGGRATGQHMSHYVVPGGRFEASFQKLAATGWALHLESTPTRVGKVVDRIQARPSSAARATAGRTPGANRHSMCFACLAWSRNSRPVSLVPKLKPSSPACECAKPKRNWCDGRPRGHLERRTMAWIPVTYSSLRNDLVIVVGTEVECEIEVWLIVRSERSGRDS
jgi:hypothetical protein